MFACGVVTVMGKHWPATSHNGCGGVVHEEEMGVYVFESITQDWISSTSSDDDESHVSTESGCVSSQTEYESAVKNFDTLENQWLNEPDSLQQEILYKSVFHAEVTFAVRFGIYSHLVTGNQQEVSIAKGKTRNRMRTRLKNKCCIGLPVLGRALKKQKPLNKKRMRFDPETQQMVSWSAFQQRHKKAMPDDFIEMWKNLSRMRLPSKARWWEGEAVTWKQCMDRYLDFFDMSSLRTWYKKLPRAH